MWEKIIFPLVFVFFLLMSHNNIQHRQLSNLQSDLYCSGVLMWIVKLNELDKSKLYIIPNSHISHYLETVLPTSGWYPFAFHHCSLSLFTSRKRSEGNSKNILSSHLTLKILSNLMIIMVVSFEYDPPRMFMYLNSWA